MKKENVTHKGVIVRISGNTLTLRTDEACQCDGCAVVALCNKSEGSGSELLNIDTPEAADFREGERVEATASSDSTLLAAFWALIVPTVLFIGTILGMRFAWPDSGAWSIGAGFLVLGIYDFFLWLARKRIARRVSWKVSRLP